MVLRPDVKEKIQKLRFKDNLSIRMIARQLRLSPTTVAKYCAQGENQGNIVSPSSRSERNEGNKKLDDDCLDEYEMLDRIISEVTSNFRRPGIVRMVAPYLSNPRKSLSVLAEALTLTGISQGDKKLILRNWADHVGIKGDISEYFG
jgi:IS30 family transposase